MSRDFVPYNFTSGRYRAKLRTTYTDAFLVQKTKESEPYKFTGNLPSSFHFVTNPNIKLDESTYEVPNANLVSEGTFKGIHYSLYDNSLAILTGAQTEAITSEDENTRPWVGYQYVYAAITILSGYIFKSDTCKELQMGVCEFDSNTSDVNYFISGSNYLLVNITNLAITGLTVIGNIFNTLTTKDIYGLQEFINKAIISANAGVLTNWSQMFNNLVISDKNATLTIDVPSTVTNTSGMVETLNGEGLTVNVHVNSAVVHNNLRIGHVNTYNLTIDDPIETPANLSLRYSGAENIYLDIEISSNWQDSYMCPQVYGCNNLEYLTYSNRFNTSRIKSFYSTYYNNPKLKDISKIDSNGDYVSPFDFSLINRGTSCFENDVALETFGRSKSLNIIADKTVNDYFSCSKMFHNTPNLKIDVYIENYFCNSVIELNQMFEGSGVKSVHMFFDGQSTSTYPTISMPPKLQNCFANCENLEEFSITLEHPATASSSANAITNIASGCVKLLKANFACYRNAGNPARGWSFGNSDNAFDGCTSLKELILTGINSVGNSYSNFIDDCIALERITLSKCASDLSVITFPKTMYYNGVGYTKPSGLGTDITKVYTSTP